MNKASDIRLQCESTAQILKTLAHPQRLELLCHLSQGVKSVGELVKLGDRSQSATSQFLLRMKAEGILRSRRAGQSVFYEIADHRILKLIQSLHRIFCS